MTPLISVVMSTYNGKVFIKEAIHSVLDQTFTDFEFIIVDDGSTDNTAQIINSFKDDRIQYIKKEKNSGISDSLNLGISKAKGKYIARMDDDDVCMLNRFEAQLSILEKNEDLVFCGSSVLNNASETILTPEKHDDIAIKLLFRNPIFHPTAMMRKEIFLKHKYNIERVPSEDYDLWSRLLFEGKFYQIQEPLLYVRVHDQSVTMNRRKEQLLKNVAITRFMFYKHGFTNLINNEENIRIFTSHDYSISGKKLRNLIKWFEELKLANANDGLFRVEKFNNVADTHLEQFIISFFTNQKISKKIIPFFNLNFIYKMLVVKYYFRLNKKL